MEVAAAGQAVLQAAADALERAADELDAAAVVGGPQAVFGDHELAAEILRDNFEWQKGFAMTFGLIAVDRSTMERLPKPSLRFLGSQR